MVVEADGQVHRFDRYWRYTRVTHPVGSGSAVESYPSDLVGPGILLVPFLEAAWWVFPALVTGVGAVVHYRRSRRPTALLGGGLAVAFLYGVAVRQHAARPLAFAAPLVPLALALTALLLPACHVARTRSRLDLAVPLLVTYAPTLLSAVMLLGPALRPL
jgi:branched-subunit amino acid transport protein